MRINAQRARSKPMKAGTIKPKRSDLERQPRDRLTAAEDASRIVTGGGFTHKGNKRKERF